jgi:hypothetical protein
MNTLPSKVNGCCVINIIPILDLEYENMNVARNVQTVLQIRNGAVVMEKVRK